MLVVRRITKWTMLLLLVFVAACASGGTEEPEPAGGGAASADAATIIVINEQAGTNLIQVYIEPVGGIRANLGRVEPNRTGTFTYSGPPGQYVITATSVDTGTSRTSERFTLRAGRTITWDMVSNRVTFRDG
jgi:hypothetical protein